MSNNHMQKYKNEMFSPLKSKTELICSHCGKIIPIASYYEHYREKDYHIECIWDKLVNKMEENSYDAAKEFFFKLQRFVGRWPAYGFDVQEDYLSDLELVKSNNRRNKYIPINSIKETLNYYVKENI